MIVIRSDLGMRRGKEVAQGAHAAMAWLTIRLCDSGFLWSFDETEVRSESAEFSAAEVAWMQGSFTKIACRVRSEAELLDLHAAATSAGLEAHLITDAGRTEFGGVPTHTALAIGPDLAERIDPVTGGLELY